MNRVFEFFVGGSAITDDFKHDNGFDYGKDAQCQLQTGIKDPTRMCCGVYPIRYPFKPLNGDRGCCGQRTFLTAMHECCDEQTSFFDFSC